MKGKRLSTKFSILRVNTKSKQNGTESPCSAFSIGDINEFSGEADRQTNRELKIAAFDTVNRSKIKNPLFRLGNEDSNPYDNIRMFLIYNIHYLVSSFNNYSEISSITPKPSTICI